MMIVAKIGESLQEYRNDCPFNMIIMSMPRPDGDFWVASEDGSWIIDTTQEIAFEQSIAKSELEYLDSQYNYTVKFPDPTRAKHTQEELTASALEWRNYIIKLDDNSLDFGAYDRPVSLQTKEMQ